MCANSLLSCCWCQSSYKCNCSGIAGFGPQKLAVLAAYSLRHSLLVWLKSYKADIELGGLNPRTGLRSHSINGQNGQHSHIERAAAAAVADAAQSQTAAMRSPSPFAQMDVMHEHDREGILDSSRDSHVTTNDASQSGAAAAATGRQHQTHETEPLVNPQSHSSRTCKGPASARMPFLPLVVQPLLPPLSKPQGTPFHPPAINP